MKKRYILLILLLCGVVALIAYRINSNTAAKSNSGPIQSQTALKVQGRVLRPVPFDDNLSLSGTLEANEEVNLRSEISGVVESINFSEGAKVRKGQVLVKVNDIELRAQLSKMKTAQELASENQRRAQLLLEKQAISKEEYDMAMANFESARAESDFISAQVSKTSIRAPFDGTIGLREISVGAYVTPTTPIANLVNTQKLKLTFNVPEKYVSQMKVGTMVTFTTANSSVAHKAKIYALEPRVDLSTRTLQMRAMADNEEGLLVPGTFANVILPLETVPEAILVPTESLIPIQNGKKVFVQRDGKAKEIVVETGARTDSMVRILNGLKVGDTLLTTGVMSLREGMSVNVQLRK